MPAGVLIVAAGHACGYKILPDGRRQILDFMFPGDMSELHSLLLRAADYGIFTFYLRPYDSRLDQSRSLGLSEVYANRCCGACKMRI